MKAQLLGRILRYRCFLQQGVPISDENGEIPSSINFDFDYLSDQYLTESKPNNVEQGNTIYQDFKLSDEDLIDFLTDLENIDYSGDLILNGHNLTDQTLIRIANLIQKIPLSGLSMNNVQVSYVGGQKLGQALQNSQIRKLSFQNCHLGSSTNIIMENLQNIKSINFGVLDNNQLRYLTRQEHEIQHIGFQEDKAHPWDHETKQLFLKSIKPSLLSATIQIDNPDHKRFIGQVELQCTQNRIDYCEAKKIEFKSKDLNTEHPQYYESDDFKQNAFKFSVKQYLSNVFESLLDESLYYLEKERQNVLRDEEIYQVTKELIPKQIMEDICTADGSLIVLAKYLINKLKK